MEEQYNRRHGAVKRTFNVNDKIYVQYHSNNNWTWIPAKILKRIGSVVYECLLYKQNGTTLVVRKHANQIKSRSNSCNESNNNEQDDLITLLNEFDLVENTQSSSYQPPVQTSSSTYIQPQQLEVSTHVNTRPSRPKRIPARFADYQM